MSDTPRRHFLFLQGPHGPFFGLLSRQLKTAGHRTSRIGFNAGDRLFGKGFDSFERYTGQKSDWSAWLSNLIEDRYVTDVVLYGTTRPIHREALDLANAIGVRTHIFEEGYLRPWWITYERQGANAGSRLMHLSMADIKASLNGQSDVPAAAPAKWGDTREHIFWGAVYHAAVLVGGVFRAPFPTHREPGVPAELLIALRYLALSPLTALARARATQRIARSGAPYHLVLLQLSHDENHRAASPYSNNEAYFKDVISAFTLGAPRHHHLVFKAHPLEDGRQPLAKIIAQVSKQMGVAYRTHFLAGAKLAPLLDNAQSAVTVNSTAAHQALWRRLPVKTLGQAPHAKPEFSSSQDLIEFFADPAMPDHEAYLMFRHYLLATCQIAGGFYSSRARQRLLRRAADLILSEKDPYDALKTADASAQHLNVVAGTQV